MNIWLINHYAVPTKYYPLARPANFAKYLMRAGHEVTIFCASTVHNSDKNLIEDGGLYREDYVDGIHYVYVRDCDYQGNGIRRIINMLLFPVRLPRVCRRFPKPDAILAVSVTPMAAMEGIRLAKKYKCRGIAEIADLWPESFVAYGMIGRKNPILKPMYAYERRLYKKADALIFSMEGGRDYIIEKGWDKEHGGPVDLNKVYHINNGVDLEEFDYNKEHNAYADPDLDDPNTFKVVYTGSIRKANGVKRVVDVAKLLQVQGRDDIKVLLWGRGDQTKEIQELIEECRLQNIILKGFIPKSTVPYILCKGDLNFYILEKTPIIRYGMSMNKFFEYFASGKPVLASNNSSYSIIDKYGCGVCLDEYTPEAMTEEIIRFADMPREKYDTYCTSARRAAEDYDFKVLTDKLLAVMGGNV